MLEAMLVGRPVAALDYHNVPRFVPTAWTISAPEQVAPVVSELLAAPARKMAFQTECLHDALSAEGPAAPRVAKLMMQLTGRMSAEGAKPAGEPDRPGRELSELYPDEPIYKDRDIASLQARLVRLQKENSNLRQALERSTLSKGLHTLGSRVSRYLRGRSRTS